MDRTEHLHQSRARPPAGDLNVAHVGRDSLELLTLTLDMKSPPPLRETTIHGTEITQNFESVGAVQNSKRISSLTLDKLGLSLSALCAFKCIGVPIIATALSLGGLAAWAHHPAVVWTVAGLALPVAAWRLIAREIRKGRVITPLAATVAGGALTLGAIGNSLPPSAAAVMQSESCCGTKVVSKEPSCCTGSEKSENTSAAAVFNEPTSFYEKIRSNAHPTLRYGAIMLGLLHLNLLLRDRFGKKGDCGNSGDDCTC